jgi:hypothetical protein
MNKKLLLATLLINTVILYFVFDIFSSKFNDINPDRLSSDIKYQQSAILNFNRNLNDIKDNELIDNFDLSKQIQLLKTIVGNKNNIIGVTGLKLQPISATKNGYLYAITGQIFEVMLFGYNFNEYIENKKIKGVITEIKITNDKAVLAIEIFGVKK